MPSVEFLETTGGIKPLVDNDPSPQVVNHFGQKVGSDKPNGDSIHLPTEFWTNQTLTKTD